MTCRGDDKVPNCANNSRRRGQENSPAVAATLNREIQMVSYRRSALVVLPCAVLLAACPTTPVTVPATLAAYAVVSGAAATVSPNSAVMISAGCAPGSVALGGGVSVGGDTGAVVRSSAPLASGGGWTVTVANVRLNGAAITVTPMAVCASRPAGYVVNTVAYSLSRLEVNSFEAACPTAAHFATGAGVATRGTEVRPFSQQIIQQPAPEKVRAGGRNYLALPGSSSFDVTAICADFTALPGREFVLSTSVGIGAQSSATLTAACPAGKSALHGAVGTLENAIVTLDSTPTGGGTGWSATVTNPELISASLSARLQVVCARTAP